MQLIGNFPKVGNFILSKMSKNSISLFRFYSGLHTKFPKMLKKILLSALSLLSFLAVLIAQKPKTWESGAIYHQMEKLNFLGSALYVAAHPDDENTRMIAYLANEVKANTAYLSLTRGDGGQNLIGTEIREMLGVLRTQELLAARRTDGGHQFFTRANDFGYSKTPDETIQVWDKEKIMADVVRTIRKWQPDIIINRFSHDRIRRTHGHHTASAMLSFEVFDSTANPAYYPEQIDREGLQPWQPRRLFFNTSWWFYGSQEAFEQADKSEMVPVDVGVYYPLLGKSNTEIAALARSQHKCQGFGSTGSRGTEIEFLQLVKGDMPEQGDLFEGINTTWSRIPGGAPIGEKVTTLLANFDLLYPYRSVPALIEIKEMIENLEDNYWKQVKLTEVHTLIEACLGLYLEGTTSEQLVTPGEKLEVKLEVTNRAPLPINLRSISMLPTGDNLPVNTILENNDRFAQFMSVEIPEDATFTTCYWLQQDPDLGMYRVDNPALIGKPESDRYLKVQFDLEIDGKNITYIKDVFFKTNDPVEGEVVQPLEIVQPLYTNLENDVYLFSSEESQEVRVTLKSTRANLSGTLSLQTPEGWKVSPIQLPFAFTLKGEEKTLSFEVTPPASNQVGELVPLALVDGKIYNNALTRIQYDHIPQQTVATPARAKLARMVLQTAGTKIGYLEGAGDKIPEALRLMGYQVDMLEDPDIKADNLAQYDAVITGIRAYNTLDRMPFYQPELLKYAANGGTLLVQYNTNSRLKIPDDELAPYPLKLSRDRVTVEDAEVRFLNPDHPVLNTPNTITSADFDGWVQERGLYFPSEWGEAFTPILSCNDPGEEPLDGSLLVAQYGAGHFIYTGLSFFRELPAGVPGAYRLFANLLALGNTPTQSSTPKK